MDLNVKLLIVLNVMKSVKIAMLVKLDMPTKDINVKKLNNQMDLIVKLIIVLNAMKLVKIAMPVKLDI